nr:unnamed protein product [Spirometra erinaceieuropaei]
MLAVRRGDALSLVAANTYEMGHEFNFAAAKIAWASDENSVNGLIDLVPAYTALQSHIQSCAVARQLTYMPYKCRFFCCCYYLCDELLNEFESSGKEAKCAGARPPFFTLFASQSEEGQRQLAWSTREASDKPRASQQRIDKECEADRKAA